MEPLISLETWLASEAQRFSHRLEQRLKRNNSPEEFIKWLLRYDAFNRGFPGAAAELAGRIASDLDRFGDIGAETVASRVLAAIFDEFLDRSTGALALHSTIRRELALFACQNLLVTSREKALKTVRAYDPLRAEIIQETRRGYGLGAQTEIFKGLGFFAGSETSGSHEFVVLNGYLDSRWPTLKHTLQQATTGQGRALYAWVADHATLEADHARAAFSAISLAIDNLRGEEEEKIQALSEVRQGIREFFHMATKFLLE